MHETTIFDWPVTIWPGNIKRFGDCTREDLEAAAQYCRVMADQHRRSADLLRHQLDARIRQIAKQRGLTARKSRSDGLWRFSDETGILKSPETGLDEAEAWDYLEERELSPQERELAELLRQMGDASE